MMKKQISKITMMASLLLAGMVNAQEFYTCVPKKNTIMNININNVDELAKAITKGVKENTQEEQWKIVDKFILKDYCRHDLPFGKYKIKICNEERIFEPMANVYDIVCISVDSDKGGRRYFFLRLNDEAILSYKYINECSSNIVELYKHK